jgi:hypothetical protein
MIGVMKSAMAPSFVVFFAVKLAAAKMLVGAGKAMAAACH